ncbi:hypothetical protein Lepto7375DRAFT_2699 [Leptolyngbya sp. PCC 7375]|nr:hypothetical protein Lepto7375DRAFT_2699 [Leptolyngbya sp. PCC 7375]
MTDKDKLPFEASSYLILKEEYRERIVKASKLKFPDGYLSGLTNAIGESESYNASISKSTLRRILRGARAKYDSIDAICSYFHIDIMEAATVADKQSIKLPKFSSSKLSFDYEQKQVRYFVERLPGEIGLDMIRVPGGTFLMGSLEDELDRQETEGPQHKTSVPTLFMGRYPITQAQWRAIAELAQGEHELNLDPASFKGDNHPVENVSWNDAVEFCARLSVYTNRSYRLPTEAEWEYACRAGTETPFYFGETITTDLANYQGTDNEEFDWSGFYGRGPKGEYRKKTTPVAHFGIANAFGLCDMHGNVWEWCQDHWHDNYEGAPTDGRTWFRLTKEAKIHRVRRGGSWNHAPRYCRSASRLTVEPDRRANHIGFRVVCNAPRAFR